MTRDVTLLVNGVAHRVEAPPFASLADTLRERLHLTGTKVGCEAGDCGACTVLLDGEQVCACLVPTGQAEGRAVTTIEGADPSGLIDRLREAFLAHGAAQCGICTPAMILAAADGLRRNPQADRRAVEDAVGGVLCRCTGYVKIVDAIMDVARGADAVLPVPEPGAAVGTRMARIDGRAKVEGRDRFGADHQPEDALWLRLVRSPHAAARFTIGDLGPVLARHPGLTRILTARDIPGANSFGVFPHIKDQPVLADGLVRMRGDPVAALVGTRAAVEGFPDADLPLIYEVLPALSGLEAALAPGAPPIHAGVPDNVLTRGRLTRGDVAAGHAAGAATASGAFETAFVEHAYVEPEAGFARRVGDRIEVTACTQAPVMDQEDVARVLGLPLAAVRIVPTACGGGFGGKLDVSLQPILAVAAWLTRRPVRMIFTRTESMAATTKRHPARIRARLSADGQGRFTAFELDGDFNTGAYASWGPTVANRVPVHAPGPYRVPHVRNRTRAVYTNDTPAGAFRGFGVPQATIAAETLIDDLAGMLGIDRWTIRRRNALEAGDTTASGQVLHASAGLPECLDALRDDFFRMAAEAEAFNAGSPRIRRGVGLACMWYGCGNTSMSNPSRMRIVLGPDGTLTFLNGAVDIGQGSSTVLLQIAADALGLGPDRFRSVIGDTDLTCDAGKTSASRQTFVSGNAARLAGEDLRRRILSLANAGPQARLTLEGARLTIADGPASRTIDLSSLPPDETGAVFSGEGWYDPPTTALDADGQGIPYATYGFAAQVAAVEVDTVLATVRVTRIVAAHDVGRAVNPTLVEGQIHGGIAQGLGLALMEEFIPGRTENLHDYLIPTAGDVPEIDVRIIEDPDPEGPYGAKGVGEPALVATAPAILSGIRHATGARLTRVPVLPHRLHAALHGTEAAE
ncbi:molybdopterin-dependent oxidoreductase [Methylobacterium nodulans]|uniref:Aldehyde oxidase and xanthine dehydrogenase molybdopterin binding n=1 Tax=Methylobacterium nodulans (strain LMG 21967 / CNCM I-2342 / ORS 2060) TaxID=460265 RepID=B8IKP1_METNO|nr:molybdopterin cofactor-binding domain-containing protein [Methylobacterium nodulans]ACL56248.1 aldehyde oxidase and xanthine dehydrogenase molybdopterin binding [Methylobacterium nodulans ORS 2060]